MPFTPETWKDIAWFSSGIIGASTIIGFAMKAIFQTKNGCEDEREKCSEKTCKKLDEIKKMVEVNREAVSLHYAEVSRFMGRIEAKLNNRTLTNKSNLI